MLEYLRLSLFIIAITMAYAFVQHDDYQKKFLSFDSKEINPFNSIQTGINVKKGDLILFPSHIQHFVLPVEQKQTRISLSFNTFVKGDFL